MNEFNLQGVVCIFLPEDKLVANIRSVWKNIALAPKGGSNFLFFNILLMNSHWNLIHTKGVLHKKLSHKGLEKAIIPSRSFVQNFIFDQICSMILYYTRIVVFNVQIINQKLKTNCSIHFTSNGNKYFLSIDWYGT